MPCNQHVVGAGYSIVGQNSRDDSTQASAGAIAHHGRTDLAAGGVTHSDGICGWHVAVLLVPKRFRGSPLGL